MILGAVVSSVAVLMIVLGAAMLRPKDGVAVVHRFLVMGTLLIVVGVVAVPVATYVFYVRWSRLKAADGYIANDRARYDRVWNTMTQDTANVEMIRRLSSAVNAWRKTQGMLEVGGGTGSKKNGNNVPMGGVTVARSSIINATTSDSTTLLSESHEEEQGKQQRNYRIESSPFGFYKADWTPARSLTNKVAAELQKARVAANTTKPRQQICDLAVLFAQAATMNEYFQGVVSGWAGTTTHQSA